MTDSKGIGATGTNTWKNKALASLDRALGTWNFTGHHPYFSGRTIRGGELAEPVREFTIAGELLAMLAAVSEAGSEPRWVPFGGSVSTPPLLIGELAVSGT